MDAVGQQVAGDAGDVGMARKNAFNSGQIVRGGEKIVVEEDDDIGILRRREDKIALGAQSAWSRDNACCRRKITEHRGIDVIARQRTNYQGIGGTCLQRQLPYHIAKDRLPAGGGYSDGYFQSWIRHGC